MIDAEEVKRKIGLLQSGALSLYAFEEWIDVNSWNMLNDSSDEAIELVSSVHSLFSLRDDRALSSSQMLHELVALLNVKPVDFQGVIPDANVLVTDDPVAIAMPLEHASAPEIKWIPSDRQVFISVGKPIFDASSLAVNSVYPSVAARPQRQPAPIRRLAAVA